MIDAGLRVVLAVFCLHAGGFLLGYLAGRLVLRREIASRTVSIEVGMQNSGLGVVLAQQNFASPLVALPCAISSVFHSLIRELGGSSVAGVRRRRKWALTAFFMMLWLGQRHCQGRPEIRDSNAKMR